MNNHRKLALVSSPLRAPAQKPPSPEAVALTRAQWREIVIEAIG